MVNVILLRTPVRDPQDPYEQLFKAIGYNVSSVPVLETVSVNLDRLKHVLLDHQSYCGVVITSARASDSWKAAVTDLLSNNSPTEIQGRCLPIQPREDTIAERLSS